jgi:uncharacterized protein YdeI (BOF family)
MKRLALAVMALGVCSFAALAAEYTGFIADSNCAASQGAKTANPEHADCAAACIKKGAKAVLVTEEGKVYKLDDQAKVVAHAGHKVTIDGELDGDTIKVSSVKM